GARRPLKIAMLATLLGAAGTPVRAEQPAQTTAPAEAVRPDAAPHVAAAPGQRYEYTQTKMGAPFKLVFYAPDQAAANRAAEAVFGRVDALNRILSDYDAESELSLLSASSPTAEPVKLSDPLWQVLTRSQALAEASDGAFDVSVGPLVRLWRRARRTRQLPDPERLAAARDAVGHRNIELDPPGHTARLLKPRMVLDLGGIAMGYTVDDVLALLAEHGIRRALVDASGDIGLAGAPADKPGWTIGIAPLAAGAPASRYVVLSGRAITTSGDAFQHVEIDGKRYSHIVDPHTGYGLTDSSSVTVIADDCITADSLATAVSVLGPERGLELIAKTSGAEAFFMRMESGRLATYQSPGFERFVAAQAQAAPAGDENTGKGN
ncbi:MAG TPA: FAD:protein FMN transferase, partial [Pirellulales bacterium]|nr:FAD:protein FMN transferase [Pirellulales bacterium]